VLADDQKRSLYDRYGHAGVGAANNSGVDPSVFVGFEDILGGLGDIFGFGDVFGGRRRGGPQRGADLRYSLEIAFEESAKGTETTIQVPRAETCESCKGSGAAPGTGATTCPTCHGRGQLRYQQGFLTVARTCSQCGGEGQIIKNPCKTCSGEGRVPQERTLKVRIPPGVDEGAQLRVTGEGEGGVGGGPPGDLYVVLHVKQHPFFTREGNELYCALPLTFAQAALGAEVDVPILNGVAQLKVPAGTQNADVLRLRGKGMPSLHGRGRGDACYSVVVEVPRKLTSRQREILEDYQRVSSGEEQGPLVGGFLESLKKLFGG
jgi:molecular chaperone DnaJ